MVGSDESDMSDGSDRSDLSEGRKGRTHLGCVPTSGEGGMEGGEAWEAGGAAKWQEMWREWGH